MLQNFDLFRNEIDFMSYLPTYDKINNEIESLLNNDGIGLSQLCDIVKRDQSFAAKLIALANSPAYGLQGKVTTIEMAISILGIEMVRDIIVSMAIVKTTLNDNDRYFYPIFFNEHSYLTGYASQLLSVDFNYPVKNEAFVAGLLHDIGIAIIHKYLSNEFKLISELKFYRKINQTRAEKIILGKTHSEIGAEIASKWNIPESLCDVILNHHNPSQSKVNPKLTAIVHLADYIVTVKSNQFLLTPEDEGLDKSIVEILKLPDESYLYDVINNVSELIFAAKGLV